MTDQITAERVDAPDLSQVIAPLIEAPDEASLSPTADPAIVRSANGALWRLTVSNTGKVTPVKIAAT